MNISKEKTNNKKPILYQVSNCDLIPDAKARLGGFSMFKFSFPLDEDFLYCVSILRKQKIIVKLWKLYFMGKKTKKNKMLP